MKRIAMMVLGLVLMAAASGAFAAEAQPPAKQPVIEMAILLDTSGSMSGLIEQAKSGLWGIVNEFIGTKKDGVTPALKVALYEYGNDGLPAQEGFIRQILPLTDDLDKVSQELFALKTNGGNEFCGQVIDVAVRTLTWSENPEDLKVIFIAGNEPFTQGPVPYADACKAAAAKGIIVNTIHCGNAEEGIRGEWDKGAALADGRYMTIDQNQAIVQYNAPQDKRIAELGAQLNETYIPYGAAGAEAKKLQTEQDANATGMSASVNAMRQVSKASGYYRNSSWDVVDAIQKDGKKLDELKDAELPENMQKMTLKERQEYVEKMTTSRANIQAEIAKLNIEREKFVAAERAKAAEKGEQTFDAALISAVVEQAEAKNYQK